MSAWIEPALTLPQGVHVVTTVRHGLGESASPFNEFNLGLRSGDEVAVVQRNRQALADLPQATRRSTHDHPRAGPKAAPFPRRGSFGRSNSGLHSCLFCSLLGCLCCGLAQTKLARPDAKDSESRPSWR